MVTELNKLSNKNYFPGQITGSVISKFPENQIADISGNVPKNETGNEWNNITGFKTITIPFDKYSVKVVLSSSNEFIGIEEIELNKDFLSLKQKIRNRNFHDIEKFYVDE
jgi:hypothetical protein